MPVDANVAQNHDQANQTSLSFFREEINAYAFAPKSSVSLRTSPRKRTISASEDVGDGTTLFSPVSYEHQHRSTDRSPKKTKRGYAAPEIYGHLNVLQDYLKENLDIIFCGINPGYKSAESGHHFANPTNHFWRCLHQSGLTNRLLSPTEDFTLPDQYCLGVTNLVDRPSMEVNVKQAMTFTSTPVDRHYLKQAELSKTEMVLSVPAFLSKVARLRPRVVCLIGCCIWDIIKKTFDTMLSSSFSDVTRSPSLRKKLKAPKRTLCLQPYKLIYDDVSTISNRETFFFVVPSTSGRVVSHQLRDKVKLFSELKRLLEDVKGFKIDSSTMTIIPLPDERTRSLP